MKEKIKLLNDMIENSKNLVFFGGAGVSTESGIPDFRSKDGLYNNRDVQFEGYSPEYLLSRECMVSEPEVFFEFYRQKLDTRSIKPNPAHYALAELERRGKLRAVITQNIDGLHQSAGSKTVYEIHGTTRRNYCIRCKKRYPADHIFDTADPVPRCACGGIIRCDVTLYGEQLPQPAVEGAIQSLSEADTLIIGGTSLKVYPAASFIGLFKGKSIAVINNEPLNIKSSDPDVTILEINEPIGRTLSKITRT